MNTFSFSFNQKIYYSNKEKVSIKEVINGLQAAESLLIELKPSIKAMFPQADIKEINIYLEKLESGSIIEDLIIDVIFDGEEGYKKFRQKICNYKKGGKQDDNEDKKVMKQILTLAFVGAIGFGASQVLTSAKTPVPQAITNHNVVINNTVIGDGQETLSGGEIVEIIRANSDHKKIAKAAVDIVKPAKEDATASITFNDDTKLSITPEVVKAVPEKYTPPMPQETIESYVNIEISIKASDAEKRGVGWAGTIPSLVEDRKKFILAEDIEPSKLHGKLKTNADVSIIKKYNETKKEYQIKEVLIKKIY